MSGAWLDGLIVLLYLALVTALGLRVRRHDRDLLGFALGDRRMPWWAVMASIIAAETSAATFLGAPAEGFARRGVVYVQLTLGLILGRVLVGYVFLPVFFAHKVCTVYDFLAARFGPRSRAAVSALFLLMRLLASGVRLYVPSLLMVAAWRLLGASAGAPEALAPYAVAIVLLTAITCLYTAAGGLRAVIFTDVLQAALMAGGALLVLLSLVLALGQQPGGGSSVATAAQVLLRHVPEMGQLKGYVRSGLEDLPQGASLGAALRQLLATPYTLPAALIASTISNLAAFGTDQDMVQRLLSAPDARRSRRSLVAAALLDVPVALGFTLIGVLLIAFYDLHPELRPRKISDVMGVYILSALPAGLRGLVLAGVLATAMGSLSAALNALGTTFVNDWYAARLRPGQTDRHYVAAARLATGGAAALMAGVAVTFAHANLRRPGLTIIPVALGVAGYVLGPMLGVFLVGILTRGRGSDRGNLLAIAAGLAAVFVGSGLFREVLAAAWPGAPEPLRVWLAGLPRLEFTWFTALGATVTAAIAGLFPTPAPQNIK